METEFIAWLRDRLPPHPQLLLGAGDDAAILRLAGRPECLLTVDLLTDQEADLDEKIFGLILHNLLSNAIAHGTGEIRLRLHAGDGTATLLVLNRVQTKTYTEAGTGIGLRTVAVLAQAHNLGFRSRRIFNNYGAVMQIATLAPVGETVPKSQSKLSV